jgi:hypothetical protein
MTRKREKPSRDEAEILAVAALSFLAEEPDRLGRFLAITGIEPENLRDAAGTPGFLPGVLDHLIGDESLLLDFAAQQGIDPADVPSARAAFGGHRT